MLQQLPFVLGCPLKLERQCQKLMTAPPCLGVPAGFTHAPWVDIAEGTKAQPSWKPLVMEASAEKGHDAKTPGKKSLGPLNTEQRTGWHRGERQ